MSSPSTNTLYNLSIGAYINSMKALMSFMKKAEAHADANGIPHSQLLEARLIADMEAFPYQIQRLSDAAKFAAVRVGGIEPVPMADDEKTFEQLYARIQKTIDLLQTVKPSAFEGKDATEITVKLGGQEHKWTTTQYLTGMATPNFYFHVTTAYALLRKEGMPLGKRDFLTAA